MTPDLNRSLQWRGFVKKLKSTTNVRIGAQVDFDPPQTAECLFPDSINDRRRHTGTFLTGKYRGFDPKRGEHVYHGQPKEQMGRDAIFYIRETKPTSSIVAKAPGKPESKSATPDLSSEKEGEIVAAPPAPPTPASKPSDPEPPEPDDATTDASAADSTNTAEEDDVREADEEKADEGEKPEVEDLPADPPPPPQPPPAPPAPPLPPPAPPAPPPPQQKRDWSSFPEHNTVINFYNEGFGREMSEALEGGAQGRSRYVELGRKGLLEYQLVNGRPQTIRPLIEVRPPKSHLPRFEDLE